MYHNNALAQNKEITGPYTEDRTVLFEQCVDHLR